MSDFLYSAVSADYVSILLYTYISTCIITDYGYTDIERTYVYMANMSLALLSIYITQVVVIAYI